jgi:arylsulfatase A-like enzyme
MTHVENELIDEACGRVLGAIAARGWEADTDVFFTTDHGELQGDYGLMFKGAYHVDALLRVPFIWRPAPNAGVAPGAVIDQPVGHIDLAPTFCAIAGLTPPAWMEGKPLPVSSTDATAQRRERVMTEWDSTFNRIDMHLRTIYRDGVLCTAYEPGSLHDGTEGELYVLDDDPLQLHNRWADPARKALRDDLVADLYDSLPPPLLDPRPVVANV